jgi:phospholipase/carboxylesterase
MSNPMAYHPNDPHADARVFTSGVSINQARAALILLHGRGSNAHDILGLAEAISLNRMVVFAPNAVGHTWYPQRFIRPVAENEPYLTSALNLVARMVSHANDSGIPTDKIIIGGFSQGACLASEFVARNPTRYGGLAVFSGGLIGESVARENYPANGTLAGTPVFVGCSDVDFHIPVGRVHETTATLSALGGDVTERIYEGMDHTINDDELAFFAGMVKGI